MFKDTVIGLISLIAGWVFFIRIDMGKISCFQGCNKRTSKLIQMCYVNGSFNVCPIDVTRQST